ncbi:MAG: DUF456 domain-containing protein [Bacteroidales bacterium]|jgi:uncharacterized protein YqgC (DUF456 family)|nr:DUF456 domain-containing protein [Bacteroidales bacterium]MDN5349375.1 uncharacterized protein [Bacteroidales bacterium]
MDIIWIILAFLLILIGLLGAIIPGLPGPPFAWLALIVLNLTEKISYSTEFFAITALFALAITLLDYYVPIYGTKKFGGSKAGVWGSTIGLIVGIFVLPFLGIVIGPFGLLGIILGPFLGAYIGEKWVGKADEHAWRSAWGSFLGFLAGTFIKIAYALVIGYFVVRDLIVA